MHVICKEGDGGRKNYSLQLIRRADLLLFSQSLRGGFIYLIRFGIKVHKGAFKTFLGGLLDLFWGFLQAEDPWKTHLFPVSP